MGKEIVTIGDLLTEYIKSVIEEEFPDHPPTFIVSKLFEDSQILLTITNYGWSHTSVIGFQTDIKRLIHDLQHETT